MNLRRLSVLFLILEMAIMNLYLGHQLLSQQKQINKLYEHLTTVYGLINKTSQDIGTLADGTKKNSESIISLASAIKRYGKNAPVIIVVPKLNVDQSTPTLAKPASSVVYNGRSSPRSFLR